MEVNKVSNLNRIFTRSTLRQFIDCKYDNTYPSIVKKYISNTDNKSNEQLLSEIYCVLRDNYRNEYFYKNTLLNKLLLGIHSLNTTTALTEVPIAKSKADFILINGKAIVYEIKTELDNFERLETQLNDYYKAFDHVAVVTCKNNIESLEKIISMMNKPIGIYVLQRNGRIGTIIKPQKYVDDLDKETIFKILRKNEYESIIEKVYGVLPNVSQFRYYTVCKELFVQIPLEKVYNEVLKQLKQRVIVERKCFEAVPYELKFLAYFMGLKQSDYEQLNTFLKKQY